LTYSFAYVDEDKDAREDFANDAHLAGFEENEITVVDPDKYQELDEMVEYLLQLRVDALITDYDLTQFSTVNYTGNDLINCILQKLPEFPCFVRTNYESKAVGTTSDVNRIYSKLNKDKETNGEDEPVSFFDRVKRQIQGYRSTIEKRQAKLFELLEIPNEILTPSQIEQILELDDFLEKSVGGGDASILIKNVKRNALLSKRNILIDETDRLIKKIQDRLDDTK